MNDNQEVLAKEKKNQKVLAKVNQTYEGMAIVKENQKSNGRSEGKCRYGQVKKIYQRSGEGLG